MYKRENILKSGKMNLKNAERIKKKIKRKFKQGLACLLIVTMLPFAGFAAAGVTKVYAKGAATKNQAEGFLENAQETPVSVNSGADVKKGSYGTGAGEVKTYGGEDIDAFLNSFLNGEMQGAERAEDLMAGENYSLTEDLTVNSLTLEAGVMNLNGHTLYVLGDFIQTGGTLEIGDGRLVVCGNYHISGEGAFTMAQETAYLLVMGNFHTESIKESSRIYLGIMEVKGDFTQNTPETVRNFYTSGFGDEGFTLYLTGSSGQKFFMENSSFNNSSIIANLVIDNQSEEGVVLENVPCVSGKVTTGKSVVAGELGIGCGTIFTEDYFDGGITVCSNTGAGPLYQEEGSWL